VKLSALRGLLSAESVQVHHTMMENLEDTYWEGIDRALVDLFRYAESMKRLLGELHPRDGGVTDEVHKELKLWILRLVLLSWETPFVDLEE
jgi:hypothetical protein